MLTTHPVTYNGGESIRLLTDAARSIIKPAIERGEYSDRAGGLEPPFMAPSVDPNDYSLVSPPLHIIRRAICSIPKVVFVLQRFWGDHGPLHWVQGCHVCSNHRPPHRLPQVGTGDQRSKLCLPLLFLHETGSPDASEYSVLSLTCLWLISP